MSLQSVGRLRGGSLLFHHFNIAVTIVCGRTALTNIPVPTSFTARFTAPTHDYIHATLVVESARYNHAETLSFMNLTRSPPAVVVVPSGRTPRASSLRADLLRARARAGPYVFVIILPMCPVHFHGFPGEVSWRQSPSSNGKSKIVTWVGWGQRERSTLAAHLLTKVVPVDASVAPPLQH